MNSTDLARILVDPASASKIDRGRIENPGLFDLARANGVQSLLFSALNEAGLSIDEQLRRAAFHQAARFQLQDRELERVCSGLHTAKVPYMLVKGAALCYQIYPAPEERPRVDTDLFIDESNLAALRNTLASLGYDSIIAHDGGLVSYQTGMSYSDDWRVNHTVDIHWNLSNRHEYRDILGFEFVRASAVRVPRFPYPVYAPNHVFALCLACLHLVGHHAANPRLIWLYDMHLLLQKMEDREVEEFVELTRSLALEDITCQALTELNRHFTDGTVQTVLAKLGKRDGTPMADESRLALLRSNVRSFPTLSGKCRYLLALAFPPSEYIEHRYQPASKLLVPWYYVYRILKGALKTVGRQ